MSNLHPSSGLHPDSSQAAVLLQRAPPGFPWPSSGPPTHGPDGDGPLRASEGTRPASTQQGQTLQQGQVPGHQMTGRPDSSVSHSAFAMVNSLTSPSILPYNHICQPGHICQPHLPTTSASSLFRERPDCLSVPLLQGCAMDAWQRLHTGWRCRTRCTLSGAFRPCCPHKDWDSSQAAHSSCYGAAAHATFCAVKSAGKPTCCRF